MKVKNLLAKTMNYVMPVMVGASSIAMPLQSKAQSVARPPQYVLLAFDGSYRNSTWQYLRNFTKDKKAQGIDTRFTFFINPVYLLDRETGMRVYQPPGGHRGSAIGWGDNAPDISARIDQMNAAHAEGHEIGSHAVGHWDGSRWSLADWISEFKQFDWILDNVFSLNKIQQKSPEGLKFRKSIVGFRAPLLGYGLPLYQALPKFGIQYDTSQQDPGMTYWPQVRRDSGTWNFPLARVAIPGTAKKYPTMDYNFCANDSLELLRANPDLINYTALDPVSGKVLSNRGKADCLSVVPNQTKQMIKQRTVGAYMNYFNNNYYGDRAPVSIGHHFSPWMSGAYMEAIMQIAENVCNKPEVKCVTYRELMGFMEKKTESGDMDYYRAGNFAKLARPKAARAEVALDINAQLVQDNGQLVVSLSGRDAQKKGFTTSMFVNGQSFKQSTLDLSQVRALVAQGEDVKISAVVSNRQGLEVQSVTHILEKVGTALETFKAESLESTFQKGDLPGAHEGTNAEDFTQGN